MIRWIIAFTEIAAMTCGGSEPESPDREDFAR
jgi:hypothetical protein